jgi:hypothetical protein
MMERLSNSETWVLTRATRRNIPEDIIIHLLSRLRQYMDEIIRDHQCGFRRNISPTAQIFCIRQMLEEKREYNEAVRELLIAFKKPILYNILIQFGVPMKLVRPIKMGSNGTSEVSIGKHLPYKFSIQNDLKQGYA